MIFSSYRDLINYVLSHYPYEKIIEYSRELRYPWTFSYNYNVFSDNKPIGKYPTKNDIKKYLVCILSNLLRHHYNDIVNRNGGEYEPELSEDDKRILDIGWNNSYITSFGYLNAYFRKGGRELLIRYKFSFSGRFNKYSLPYVGRYGSDPRTKVVFRFSGKDDIV